MLSVHMYEFVLQTRNYQRPDDYAIVGGQYSVETAGNQTPDWD